MKPIGSAHRAPVAAILPPLLWLIACSNAPGSSDGGTAGNASTGGAGGAPMAGAGGALAGAGGVTGGAGGAQTAGAGGVTGGAGGAQTAGAGGAATGGAGGAQTADAGDVACVHATRLWFEDFETNDYSRWTSETYGGDWGNECQSNGFTTERARSGERSHRSEIVCSYPDEGNVHRGYGGLQFNGDAVVPAYTNSGAGIDAPHGLVNTYWSYLETPTAFSGGTWFSFWTINSACDWSDPVLTLGLEDTSGRLAAAHYWHGSGGERTFATDAPAFPRGQWVRTTIYVNYHDDVMHVWQDGQEVSHVTFDRDATTICHFHWGAYASGDNDDIVLFEDDLSIWKLAEPWMDFSVEPYLGETIAVCDP
jgi:hypothetical protein